VEITVYRAVTESGEGWEPRTTQTIKWTTEGAVKGNDHFRVFCDVTHTSVARDMLVSCRVYRDFSL